MDRPSVDVVVPFAGSEDELIELCRHLLSLKRQGGDSLIVVDNRPSRQPDRMIDGVRVIRAPDIQGSYYARNRGAEAGSAPWILFVDADVRVEVNLIDQYFATTPAERTAVLAGEIANEPADPSGRQPIAVRYADLAQLFAQRHTLDNAFAYAMTANCMIRRDAFEGTGGFVENIRSGGDADICIRLRNSGWELESRPEARVTHVSRDTIRKLVRQSARHGSGAAWLERLYPGFSPAGRVPGAWGSRRVGAALLARMKGDRDRALVYFIDGVRSVAFDLGRRVANDISTVNNGRGLSVTDRRA
jgi:GT2 family glycosyltransferase